MLAGRGPRKQLGLANGLSRAALVAGVGMNLKEAQHRFENGDIIGGLLSLGCAAADVVAATRSCFTADMLLDVEGGKKRADAIVVGDKLWSRDEFDSTGPVELKKVEEVFVRVAPIWQVDVAGQRLRTTAEHPFYVLGRGWIPAKMLEIGDVLLTRCGKLVPVEGVADSGTVETVYNWQVGDYHTYFVSATLEGVSVWAHNAEYDEAAVKKLLEEARTRGADFEPLQGSGGRGKVYLMDSERMNFGKEYVGSTKREVGTGRKGKDRMEDADHRAKTTDQKAPTARGRREPYP